MFTTWVPADSRGELFGGEEGGDFVEKDWSFGGEEGGREGRKEDKVGALEEQRTWSL